MLLQKSNNIKTTLKTIQNNITILEYHTFKKTREMWDKSTFWRPLLGNKTICKPHLCLGKKSQFLCVLKKTIIYLWFLYCIPSTISCLSLILNTTCFFYCFSNLRKPNGISMVSVSKTIMFDYYLFSLEKWF